MACSIGQTHNRQETSMAASKSAALTKTKQSWKTMDGAGKMLFVAKVCVMVCSFGFIFGGVLVEGMKYESH
jgi:hypothetical protein